MKKLVLAALAVALLSGCAFNAQTVQLNPVVASSHSTEVKAFLSQFASLMSEHHSRWATVEALLAPQRK